MSNYSNFIKCIERVKLVKLVLALKKLPFRELFVALITWIQAASLLYLTLSCSELKLPYKELAPFLVFK